MFAQDFTSRPRTVAAQATRPRTVTVPEAVFVAGEKAIAERDHLLTVVTLKDEQIAAKDQQIAALNTFVEIQRAQVKEWSTAALERKEAIVFDDRAAKLQDAEILRVRAERDSARRAQKTWGIGGAVLGIVIGVLSQRKK